MDIYHKSLDILKKIVENQEKFNYKVYLVGGWSVWMYNPYMKSKDIDILVKKEDFWKLRNLLLNEGFRETSRVLEKHGFAMLWGDDKIEIDVYDDKIGKFSIDEFVTNAIVKKMNRWDVRVVSVDDLFLMKVYTAGERLGTAKGEKDLSDLLALLDTHYKQIDFKRIAKTIKIAEIVRILFADYRSASKIYPISYEKYHQIAAYMKSLGIL
ncbi:MAG: nucleotidyltransferase family protein [Candidatus Aenigmarchaeota archaeon]|nr:nucleotidyltransferase family protein [Candidatus Aenigmarchaeota archaeon]